MRLLLFEDEYTRRLNPLVHLRPVYDLKFGIRTIREKYQNIFEEEFETLHCREELAGFKIPKKVCFGPIEKTSTGKVQKFLLREKAENVDLVAKTG